MGFFWVVLQCASRDEKARHILKNIIECLATVLRKAKLNHPNESIRLLPSIVLGGKVNGYRLEPVFEVATPVIWK